MWPIDHVAVATGTLAAGEARLAARLGVPAGGGGAHPTMGTHNRLWSLGPAYLELIAIDPAAPHPGRPRWFGLDDAARPEGLAGWVLRVADIAAALAACPLPPGRIERHHRGAIHWQLTVPEAGLAPAGGTLPLLIEWPAGVTPPPATLSDAGLRLRALTVTSPAAAAIRALPLPPEVRVAEGPPALAADILLPGGGTVTLR
jgi:hypothetical protein